MMEDMIFTSGNFLQSLIECRSLLTGSPLLEKLDEVIAVELELALMGAKKAKSAILKEDKDNVRPIK